MARPDARRPRAGAPHQLLRNVFLGVIGEDVEVGPAYPVVAGRGAATVSLPVTDELGTGAAIACDLPRAACAGAASGLVPLPPGPGVHRRRLTARGPGRELLRGVNLQASIFDDNPE